MLGKYNLTAAPGFLSCERSLQSTLLTSPMLYCRGKAFQMWIWWLWQEVCQQQWSKETFPCPHQWQALLLQDPRLWQILYPPELAEKAHEDSLQVPAAFARSPGLLLTGDSGGCPLVPCAGPNQESLKHSVPSGDQPQWVVCLPGQWGPQPPPHPFQQRDDVRVWRRGDVRELWSCADDALELISNNNNKSKKKGEPLDRILTWDNASLRQTRDSALPPGLISPIYSVWNPMVFVHLINLIKIFGLFFPLRKQTNKQKTQPSWTCMFQGDRPGSKPYQGKWMESLVNQETHCQCNIYICSFYKGERKSIKSELNTATRPLLRFLQCLEEAFDTRVGFSGASQPPAWALILPRPLDCKPHTCCIANKQIWDCTWGSRRICKNPLSSNTCNF